MGCTVKPRMCLLGTSGTYPIATLRVSVCSTQRRQYHSSKTAFVASFRETQPFCFSLQYSPLHVLCPIQLSRTPAHCASTPPGAEQLPELLIPAIESCIKTKQTTELDLQLVASGFTHMLHTIFQSTRNPLAIPVRPQTCQCYVRPPLLNSYDGE